jgi:hypothetical protein
VFLVGGKPPLTSAQPAPVAATPPPASIPGAASAPAPLPQLVKVDERRASDQDRRRQVQRCWPRRDIIPAAWTPPSGPKLALPLPPNKRQSSSTARADRQDKE